MKRLLPIIVAVSVLALLVLVALTLTRQTKFGKIKRAKMIESHNPTRIEQVQSKAREVLQLSAMDTRQRNYLKVDDSLLEWSLKSTTDKTGWLYFFKPDSNDEMWEFAPCARTSLLDIVDGDLEAEFLRFGDPRHESIFGTDLRLKAIGAVNGRAILVREGPIVLARLLHPRHLVYAIKLVDQKGAANWGSIGIEYVVIDSRPVH